MRRSGDAVRYQAFSDVLALVLVLSAGAREEPIHASIAEFHRHPSRFHGREILVRGELDPGRTPFDETYLLRENGLSVALIAPPVQGTELSFLLLKRVEVRGTFRDHSIQAFDDTDWKRNGRFVLLAIEIVEVSEGTPSQHVEEPGPPPDLKPGARPPEIVSVQPQPGRRDLSENTVFEIRFSTDMDEATLESNVWLRLGDIGREPSSFVPAEFAYNRETRTLTVSPLEALPKLTQVTLSFYRGIAGADGEPLHVVQRAPGSLQSRRSAVKEGADLRELLVLTFVTRGF